MKEDILIKKTKWVMTIFLMIAGVYQLYNIICNTIIYVSPDMSSTVLLANEQIKMRQLYPEGFHHSTGVFTIHLNLLMIPFMLFLNDWLLCRELAVIVLAIIGVFCISVFFKKMIKCSPAN